ncbi:hypothetical protein [Sorangium sp. So ce590]|uniref:hypothetical protein n=1 Tax=unclassified Sorangium TaxID=2621164 RepID=UPI003F5EC566
MAGIPRGAAGGIVEQAAAGDADPAGARRTLGLLPSTQAPFGASQTASLQVLGSGWGHRNGSLPTHRPAWQVMAS